MLARVSHTSSPAGPEGSSNSHTRRATPKDQARTAVVSSGTGTLASPNGQQVIAPEPSADPPARSTRSPFAPRIASDIGARILRKCNTCAEEEAQLMRPACGRGVMGKWLSDTVSIHAFEPRIDPDLATHPTALVRTKLPVSRPGDPHEQEADRVTEHVMGMDPPTRAHGTGEARSTAPAFIRQTPRIDLISPAPSTRGGGDANEALVGAALQGGEPLDAKTRAWMEPRFGADFSDVRVHTGHEAAHSAHTLNALAYTYGHHIVFAPGHFEPSTIRGKHLVAHELTHVLQQRGRRDGGKSIVQRQARGEEDKDKPLTQAFEVEYVAYDPYEEEEERSSIYPAMCTAVPQALGYWTNPPGSAFSESFKPAWARQLAFSERLGQQPGGDWLLDRNAGTTSYNPRDSNSSRVKEFFGLGLRDEMYPRSFLRAEKGGNFATFTKMTPEQIKSIPDILRRVNSGGKLSYTAAELDLLYKAASAHGDWDRTVGSPFLSTTTKRGLSTEFEPTKKLFLSGRPYVVRIRVPHSMVLEMNKMPKRLPTLYAEQEMLVTTDLRNRIVAVQPNPTSSLARGEPYMRWGGRAFLAFGLGASAYRIATANEEDRGVVIMQEVASHGGGLAGAGIGASGCVAFGVATSGVGLFACGLVGAWLGAKAADRLVTLPFLGTDALVNLLPYAMLELGEVLGTAGTAAGTLTDAMFAAPVLRTHALMDPGNWDMRYFSPEVAPDVAAVGVAMWERLGPLQADQFMSEISKPIGSFGVPVAPARRIAAFLSGPDKQYNANMPALYASLGTSLSPASAVPGTNILEMKPHELIELLATRKLNFIQDPDYLAGYASRLEAERMSELRLRLLIEQREHIAEDNWSFPGKTHQQVRALRLVGQYVWHTLKKMDERDFNNNVSRKLSTFDIPDWAFHDAARTLNELSAFGTPPDELTESERAQHGEVLAELAREIGEMTPEDYAYQLMEGAGLVHVNHPRAESYAAIERVRRGYQPW